MQGDEVILVHACQGKLAAIANQSKGDWLCLRSPRYAARRFGTSVGSLLGAGGSMAALGVAGVVAGSTAALPALPAVAVLALAKRDSELGEINRNARVRSQEVF